ncbi:MAG: DUF1297 domain-containing protein [Candidatus Saliniplasma sp.]
MVDKNQVTQMMEGYNKDEITIATGCSHSSMQVFDGARKEGFDTLRIAVDKKRISPSFVVTGYIPVVIRESLLPEVFKMGGKVVDRSYELFGGLHGSFCLETIVTEDLDLKVFEILSRIVAGTKPFISGSPYADLIEENLSTGRRISQEIKLGIEKKALDKIAS